MYILISIFHMWWFDTNFFYRCEDLVSILHVDKVLVPILHIVLVFHTLKTIKMCLSTSFTLQKLSKLTVGKFHFCQKWCFGTNSSHGVKFTKCEICGSTEPSTGPRSAVGNVSGYRCVSDCRSRGREFDPGPVPYFRGDWSWNYFYGHSPPSADLFKKGCCQLQAKVCAQITG